MTPEDEIRKMPKLIERYGRISHKSEDKITDDSAANFIKRIAIKRGHESIMEHCSITVCFIMSRAASHQIVRHRLAAYTQESQRYCDYNADDVDGDRILNVICPPSIRGRFDFPEGTVMSADAEDEQGTLFVTDFGDSIDDPESPMQVWTQAVYDAYKHYIVLREQGIPSEDARFVLPNASKTEIYATYNLRTWRHVFRMRCDSHAQWEIRSLMTGVFDKLRELLPCIFGDMLFG